MCFNRHITRTAVLNLNMADRFGFCRFKSVVVIIRCAQASLSSSSSERGVASADINPLFVHAGPAFIKNVRAWKCIVERDSVLSCSSLLTDGCPHLRSLSASRLPSNHRFQECVFLFCLLLSVCPIFHLTIDVQFPPISEKRSFAFRVTRISCLLLSSADSSP